MTEAPAKDTEDSVDMLAESISTAITPVSPAGMMIESMVGITFASDTSATCGKNALRAPVKYAIKPMIKAKTVLTITPWVIAFLSRIA